MFNKILFGKKIKELRTSHSVTLQTVGEALGTTKSTISNLERGVKAPSIDMMIALADYFDVSLDYLVGRSDDRERR